MLPTTCSRSSSPPNYMVSTLIYGRSASVLDPLLSALCVAASTGLGPPQLRRAALSALKKSGAEDPKALRKGTPAWNLQAELKRKIREQRQGDADPYAKANGNGSTGRKASGSSSSRPRKGRAGKELGNGAAAAGGAAPAEGEQTPRKGPVAMLGDAPRSSDRKKKRSIKQLEAEGAGVEAAKAKQPKLAKVAKLKTLSAKEKGKKGGVGKTLRLGDVSGAALGKAPASRKAAAGPRPKTSALGTPSSALKGASGRDKEGKSQKHLTWDELLMRDDGEGDVGVGLGDEGEEQAAGGAVAGGARKKEKKTKKDKEGKLKKGKRGSLEEGEDAGKGKRSRKEGGKKKGKPEDKGPSSKVITTSAPAAVTGLPWTAAE